MAKKIVDETLKFSIIINGDSAQKEYGQLERANRKLIETLKDQETQAKKLKKANKENSLEYLKLQQEISVTTNKIDVNKKGMTKLTKEIGINNLTQRQLRKEAGRLRGVLGNLTPNTAKWKEYNRQLKSVTGRQANLRAEMRATSTGMGKLSSFLKSTTASFLGWTAVIFGAFRALKAMVRRIAEFDKQLIAVGKTTNLSKSELKSFGKEVIILGKKLKGISTINLLKTAEVAGQLGIRGSKNILKFSETIEKLGLTSDIVGQDSARSFAKFIELSSDSVENADRLGSVITQLGNNFATTEGEILRNTTEIQKGIAIYETSAEGVIALGAATSALGSQAEASRGALQTTFKVLNTAATSGKNLNKILELTGQTQAEFVKEFGSDSIKTFNRFIKGLAKSSEEGENLSVTLTELGLDQKRVEAVVGSLAKNYNVLEGALSQAGAEYKVNTALSREAEAATKSLISISGDFSDAWGNLILSIESGDGVIARAVKGIIRFGTSLLNVLTPQTDLAKAIEKERINLRLIEIKLKDVNISNTERLRLINELKTQYPKLLENINAETVSNEELFSALKKVNDQLINKIILQKQDDKITEQNNKIASRKIELFAQEDKVRLQLIDLAEKYNLTIKDGLTLEELALDVINQRRKQQQTTGGRLVDAATELDFQLTVLKKNQNELNILSNQENILLDEKKKLQKRLNISGLPETTPSGGTVTDPNAETEDEKRERLARERKEKAQRIKDLETFEAKKLKLENDAALRSQETEFKRNQLKIKQDFDAREKEINNLKISAAKKTELKTLLDEEERVALEELNTKKEDQELQRLQDFENRKKALQNEIAALNTESDIERELAKADQQFEKEAAALELLELTEDEKTELLILLTTRREELIQSIQEKFLDESLKKQLAAHKKIIAADKTQAKAREDIANLLTGALIGLLGDSLGAKLAAIAIEGGVEAGLVAIQSASSQGKIAANIFTANAKAIAASPLTFGQPFVGINTAQGAILTASNAAASKAAIAKILGATALKGLGTLATKGFEDGLYPIRRQQDGKVFQTRFGGEPNTQIVAAPTRFIAGEAKPEMIIDGNTFNKMDPRITDYILALAGKPTVGFQNGFFPQQPPQRTEVIPQDQTNNSNGEAMFAFANAIDRLIEEGIDARAIIGDDEIIIQKDRQDKLKQTRTDAKINN